MLQSLDVTQCVCQMLQHVCEYQILKPTKYMISNAVAE